MPEEQNSIVPNDNERADPPLPDSSTEQPESPPTNMEVHHHPQLDHKPKPWKEYLLEGLMIFVAVTMGFFAESLREHISAKRVEKEYIESFVADLKADTATFHAIIPIEETAVKGLDSMLNALSATPYTDSAVKLMYYLGRKYTMAIEPMSYTLRTITQLKNAGGLRLIADKQASDSIVAYNKTVDDILKILNFTTNDFMVPSIHAGNKIFNPKFILSYNGESIINLLHSDKKITLLTTDETTIGEYISLIYQVKEIRLNYLDQVKRHRERATGMIGFFQKAYRLDNE